MTNERLDSIRTSVLTRRERAERNMRLGIYGAALTELLLFVVAFRLVDMSNRLERLVFVLSILSYTIIVLGLVALGAHVTRTVGRLLAAVDPSDRSA
jgi:hypothetical protein